MTNRLIEFGVLYPAKVRAPELGDVTAEYFVVLNDKHILIDVSVVYGAGMLVRDFTAAIPSML